MRKKIDYRHLIEDVCSFKCENDNYSKSIVLTMSRCGARMDLEDGDSE
jgi:hypothetical protein